MDVKIHTEHKARWVAGLSNGEVAVEGTGLFAVEKGKLSPWLKLEKYLATEKLKITSLSIQMQGRVYNLPSQNPRFRGKAPIAYGYFRKIILDTVKGDSRYICIEAIYEHNSVQLYVDETGKSMSSWVVVV